MAPYPPLDLPAMPRWPARGARVDKLAAAQRGPAVDIDKDARLGAARRELGVGQLREVSPERGAVSPHVDLAGQPLDYVNARVAALRIRVVSGRQVHPERTAMRSGQPLALEHRALEEMLVVAPLRFEKPWRKIWHDATIRCGHSAMQLGGGRPLDARVPRPRVGCASPRRPSPLRVPGPRGRPGGAELDDDPAEARGLPESVQGLRPS